MRKRHREEDGTGWTLGGHEATVWSVVFSPGGELLASGGEDHFVRLWDVETGAPRGTLGDHGGGVNCVAFSPDGTLLAAAGEDGVVRIWDVKTGMERRSFTGHEGGSTASPSRRMGARWRRPGGLTTSPANCGCGRRRPGGPCARTRATSTRC